MIWYRAAKLYIYFSCKTTDGRTVFEEEGRMVAISPYDFIYKSFSSKEEADGLGTLFLWAQTIGDQQAEKAATDYCGEGTVYGDDWGSVVFDTDEGPELDKLFKPKVPVVIPADIRANIVIMLERIKANLDDIDYVENQLIPEFDVYLAEQGLTRNDIRNIIVNIGLGNIFK